MSITNPNKLEVALFTAWARTIGHREYKGFVDGLQLKGNESVLDFGSGPGVIAGMIAERLRKDGGRLTCLDISGIWMEVAKKRLREFSNIEYMLGDIRAMQIPDGTFDVIEIHYVLHDVEPGMRPGVVAALARALKPDGKIVIDEPARSSHSMPREEVRRVLGEAGLQELSSRKTWMSYIGEYSKRGSMLSRSAS